jgi:tRNA threonylcarbamoyladenosine biosynthesis protein TsaB
MILAIDTATRWLGVALHDETAVVAEIGWRCRNNHTTELAPTVQEILERGGCTPDQLQGIAVTIGPGSYTGLRIGLALAKGMAVVNQTPIIGIPTLDVVAFGIPRFAGRLIATAEAGRTRVCVAEYQWQGGRWQAIQEKPTIDLWSDVIARYDDATLFAGEINAKTAVSIQEANPNFRVAPGALAIRRAGNVAELGWTRLRNGRIDDPNHLTPIYLRDPAGA